MVATGGKTGMSMFRWTVPLVAWALASVSVVGTSINAIAAESTVEIGGRTVRIWAPEGYCPLNPDDASESRILDLVNRALAGTELLLYSASCQELADWHGGKIDSLDHVVNIQVATELKSIDIPDHQRLAVIKQLCGVMRQQASADVDWISKDINQRIAEANDVIKINELKFLGVIGEDDNGCYAAMIQKIATEAGTVKAITNVIASTVLAGRVVYVYHLGPSTGAEVLQQLSNTISGHVKALTAGNPTGSK